MSKRTFNYNFPSNCENAIKQHGTKPQAALACQGYEILGATVGYLEAVEGGDADAIETALYTVGVAYETALRMNERFHNVSDELYPKLGRSLKYDEGVDVTMFFEDGE